MSILKALIKKTFKPAPVTSANAELYMRVRRGPDWEWGTQDREMAGTIVPYGEGIAFDNTTKTKWASVLWDHGGRDNYRIEPQRDLQTTND